MKISTCSKRRLLAKCSLPDLQYQIDPYVGCAHLCRYCYALNHAETDWSENILVHGDIERQLAEETEGIPPQTIYMGWETDPYQPCEEDQGQTRRVLELLLDRGFSASILTKSTLVLRDMDILRAMPRARVGFSLAFAGERTRELFETNTMPTQARIKALKECGAAGIGTSAMICPVIPFINDPVPLIEAAGSHSDRVWVYGLSILEESETNWRNVQMILQNHFPETYEATRAAIFDKEHSCWSDLRQALTAKYSSRNFKLLVRI